MMNMGGATVTRALYVIANYHSGDGSRGLDYIRDKPHFDIDRAEVL